MRLCSSSHVSLARMFSVSNARNLDMNRVALRRGLRSQQQSLYRLSARWNSTLPVVQIENATFYRNYPSAEDSSSSTSSSKTSSNPAIFPNLTFSVENNGKSQRHRKYWAVVSSASVARTAFLQVLNNQYLSVPPTARSFPYLSSEDVTDTQLRNPERAIKYVGFDAERGGIGGTALKGAYLSARYESRKEETDWSLQEYLEGNTDLNPLETNEDKVDRELLDRVVQDLRLKDLLSRPVSNLSNGQTRRARIAKCLLSKPELLLLDGPFMGLDPPTVDMLSKLLNKMAYENAPRIVLSLRPEDDLPPWITHLVYVDKNLRALAQGTVAAVFEEMCLASPILGSRRFPEDGAALEKMRLAYHANETLPIADSPSAESLPAEPPTQPQDEILSRDAFPQADAPNPPGEAIVEMQGVKVSYGTANASTRSTVLGAWQQPEQTTPGLHWSIHRGQRWGVFGPNGSGKTTLLSLITSDHPQAYSLPVKHFGRSRLPEPGIPGITIFELQKRMGHSSPEVHTFFPKHLTLRRVLESAWADTPMSKPKLTHSNDRTVDALLRWFTPELCPTAEPVLQNLNQLFAALPHPPTTRLGTKRKAAEDELHKRIIMFRSGSDDLDWADSLRFRDLSFSQQRLALFLRAIVASPDLVILDEAFSGIDESIRDKCLLFLAHGEELDWHPVKAVKEKKKSQKQIPNKVLKPSLLADHKGAIAFEGLNENQALLVISHSKEDVPGCVREWICLPEPGEGTPARWGKLNGPLELNPRGWSEIWGTNRSG